MQKIYIVEDDKNIAEIEQFALKNAGYSVEIFKNAKDFEEKIKAEYPDLVILDVMLPDRDGLSILRDLRTGAGTAKIPIINRTRFCCAMNCDCCRHSRRWFHRKNRQQVFQKMGWYL